jgi:hypothetical protein
VGGSSLISPHLAIQFSYEEIYCGAPRGHSELQSPSEYQNKMSEASCQGGLRFVDREVDFCEEE